MFEGECKHPEISGMAFYCSEVAYGPFCRRFLNNDINIDSISAEFTNGVLTITIPKPEEVKPKQIQINENYK